MATQVEGLLPNDLKDLINSAKILLVGAGGIGCELLKNLVLTGFKEIHVIDLDTIEVSNLNRQFLFRREHVGRSKSEIARESALEFNSNVNIVSYHDSITESKYDVAFYKQFTMVMNALDNRQARSHVNRMCLAADIPLIESGSSGYMGHVTLHKKGETECYDCTTRGHQKTYPGCTIRNTPSEPIHCIVWGKHLFNQLFGLADADEDVSPDSADPEAIGDAGAAALEAGFDREKISTRQWAQNNNYNPTKLFKKLFNEDIKYLLSMKNLWAKRRPPTPLEWDELPDQVSSNSATPAPETGLKDQRIWSVKECVDIFGSCIESLRKRIELAATEEDKNLIWDKDDDIGMDFVTATANIRSFIFGIKQISRFDTKSMAGNIIPAIAATNATVSGLVVMTSFNVLRKDYQKCEILYLQNRVNVKKQLFTKEKPARPNPNCYVCAEKPELSVKVDLDRFTVRMFGERVLKKELNMIAPDVEIDDGQGTIIISSDEGDETEGIADKLLKEFGIVGGTRLKCDDFQQNYELNMTILAMDKEEADKGIEREKSDVLFEIIGDKSKLEIKPKEVKAVITPEENGKKGEPEEISVEQEEEEDDLMIIPVEAEPEEEGIEIVEEVVSPSKKRPRPSNQDEIEAEAVKKRKLEEPTENDFEVVQID